MAGSLCPEAHEPVALAFYNVVLRPGIRTHRQAPGTAAYTKPSIRVACKR
jgi:hypothetical protein